MFVIPMAGESRRFHEAGFDRPKFQLEVGAISLFSWSVSSFREYFESHPFLFVCRGNSVAHFVEQQCKILGIHTYEIVELATLTGGQAETVFLGLEQANVEDQMPVTIFNIDTWRRGFRYPDAVDEVCDGYLEVFDAPGDRWSFVLPSPDAEGLVARTVEKRRISDLCSNGLYHFARAEDFRLAFGMPRDAKTNAEQEEKFVAPIYNVLIDQGRTIRYVEVDTADVINFGTPADFEDFKRACAQGRYRFHDG